LFGGGCGVLLQRKVSARLEDVGVLETGEKNAFAASRQLCEMYF